MPGLWRGAAGQWWGGGGLRTRWWRSLVVVVVSLFMSEAVLSERSGGDEESRQKAIISYTFRDRLTKQERTKKADGEYGRLSLVKSARGIVVHARSGNTSYGCNGIDNSPTDGVQWIALMKRGDCKFSRKIKVATENNATAVVIYDYDYASKLVGIEMNKEVDKKIAVSIKRTVGEEIARLLDNGTKVRMLIEPVGEPTSPQNVSRISILFVSISFIVLMIISLAWLVFYYIQRFRYAHAKERLSRRLANAAKKAIAKIPQRTIKSGDKELESDYDQCAVCIEGYKASDVIRTLPCKHVFHKSCVDPWLLDQRSCPMCKMDILRAYGMQLNGSQDSVVHMDAENVAVSSTTAVEEQETVLTTADDSMGAAGGRTKIVHLPTTTVHFQHPHDEDGSPEGAEGLTIKPGPLVPASSFESVHSSDSECNEFQSLMMPKKSNINSMKVSHPV